MRRRWSGVIALVDVGVCAAVVVGVRGSGEEVVLVAPVSIVSQQQYLHVCHHHCHQEGEHGGLVSMCAVVVAR